MNTRSAASHEIQNKLDLLATCEKNILKLECQLKRARKLRRSLVEELGEHARPRAWLDMLPDELLCIIIEYRICGNPWRIGPFLLINKRLHLLVVNTPSLWTQISIDAEDRTYTPSLRFGYAMACLEYSQDLAIDVRMNLSSLVTQEAYIREILEESLLSVVEDYGNMSDMLDEMNFDLPCPPYQLYYDALIEVISAIIGHEGCNMQRWKSLVLYPPADNQLCDTLMAMFTSPAPKLQSLEILVTDYEDIGEQIEECCAFPDLSSVHTLKIDWGEPWFLSLNKAALVNIKILLSSTSALDQLSQCTSLQHLDVDYDGEDGDEEEDVKKGSVYLSALLSLRLSGTTDPVLARLSMPVLQKLHVLSTRLRPGQSLPSASLVQWNFMQSKGRYEPWNQSRDQGVLERILRNVSSTSIVSLSWFPESSAREFLGVLRAKKALPGQLRIVLHTSGRDVVIFGGPNDPTS